MNTRTFAAVIACASLILPAMAQSYEADPYTEITLQSGFSPDPHIINLTAGGSQETGNVVSDCDGWVAEAPDVRLNFTAGDLSLNIFVDAQADTILLINDPDGAWHCDDDGSFGMNPLIVFETPSSGQYDIWVGTLDEDILPRSTLYISEIHTE